MLQLKRENTVEMKVNPRSNLFIFKEGENKATS